VSHKWTQIVSSDDVQDNVILDAKEYGVNQKNEYTFYSHPQPFSPAERREFNSYLEKRFYL
jgi:hypothetical protein